MAEPLQFRSPPVDQPQRDAAVDTARSVIVRAPAGAGKTSLLTERYLRLLGLVDDPRRVLAITFTRSAAAEMRSRAMQALACADGAIARPENMPDSILNAAATALAVSAKRGWGLLEQPEQLNIQTIDSLALSIARQTPLTAWLGAGLTPTENAASFYKQAALKTLQRLDRANADDPRDRQIAEAAALLLRHRDNKWQQCADLLARMLQSRDQWGRCFPLRRQDLGEARLDTELRPALEAHLRRVTENHLRRLSDCLAERDALCYELLAVGRIIAPYFPDAPAHYREQHEAPAASIGALPHWLWLANLCFNKEGTARKVFNGSSKFPAGIPKQTQSAAAEMAGAISDDQVLRAEMLAVRALPPAQFTDEEWSIAKAMFRLLQQAALQLQLEFAQSGVVDFTEVGFAARQALGDDGANDDRPSELALALSEDYQHLLVDEFQDTSRTQQEFVRLLIANWNPGEGRTVFFVGDPQQSIYLFRQAEVRLFDQVVKQGIAELGPELQCLTVNFRSTHGLVEAHNEALKRIFAAGSEVEFVASQAHSRAVAGGSLDWHFSAKPPQSASSEEKGDARERDAELACDLAQAALRAPKSSVAILVRAKAHAYRIMQGLHARHIGFRAIDMEPLSDRQEVLDAFSLTRAILNPADRVAWLGLLRAPWCGLGLAALDALAGNWKAETIAKSIASGIANLQPEDQTRARHVLAAVHSAAAQLRAARLPFAAWMAWRQIGGDACVTSEQYENVCAYFAMLERMDEDGIVLRCDTMEAEMQRLCAAVNPDPSVRLEILTIHKAKGLEWDTVIVPQLDRQTGSNETLAVDWIEDQVGEDSAWFLAPVAAQGSKPSPLRGWIRRRQKQKENEEAKRLFYVAATRARRQLHLLGAVQVKDGKLCAPHSASLLRTAWPAAEEAAATQLLGAAQPVTVPAIAAKIEARPAGNTLCRLPETWYRARPAAADAWSAPTADASSAPAADSTSAPQSHDASTRATAERRMAGTVLHLFLEQAARRLEEGDDWAVLQAWARVAGPRIERLLLAGGVPRGRISRYAPNVLQLLQKALASKSGQWALGSRPDARAEFAITVWDGHACAGLRVDRVFGAGSAPLSEGDTHLWLLDYKSADPSGKPLEIFMAAQAEAYVEKMLKYAQALRSTLHDPRPIRCALYFPALDLVHQIAALD